MSLQHWSDEMVLQLREADGASLVFEVRGAFDQVMKERIISEVESYSMRSCDSVVLRKRLINVLVEGLDNLSHHTEAEHQSTCFAMLLDIGTAYRLVFGNTVRRSVAEMLTHRVAVLTDMSDADLKEHFLKLLANDGRTGRGGAGLGLVTMVRKSGREFQAHLFPADEQFARIAFDATIRRD